MIVEVLVDHLPRGAEQVHEFGREVSLAGLGSGWCSFPLTSLDVRVALLWQAGASLTLSMLACARAAPSSLLAPNLAAGWPGGPTFQLAAMARPGGSGTLGIMPVRCLIVDDNRDFLRAASDLLERQGISVVGLASTGAQAYRAAAS